MVSHSVKLGLYLPAPQHARMVEAVLGAGRGALQAAYERIRSALTNRTLKITDFVCAAIDRHLPPTTGA